MRGVPRARRAISVAPPGRCGCRGGRAERLTIAGELGVRVVVEPLDDAEAVAQRRGQQAGAGGRADQREAVERASFMVRARGPCADDDVERKSSIAG